MRKNTSASLWRALASKYWAMTGVAAAASARRSCAEGAEGAFIAPG